MSKPTARISRQRKSATKLTDASTLAERRQITKWRPPGSRAKARSEEKSYFLNVNNHSFNGQISRRNPVNKFFAIRGTILDDIPVRLRPEHQRVLNVQLPWQSLVNPYARDPLPHRPQHNAASLTQSLVRQFATVRAHTASTLEVRLAHDVQVHFSIFRSAGAPRYREIYARCRGADAWGTVCTGYDEGVAKVLIRSFSRLGSIIVVPNFAEFFMGCPRPFFGSVGSAGFAHFDLLQAVQIALLPEISVPAEQGSDDDEVSSLMRGLFISNKPALWRDVLTLDEIYRQGTDPWKTPVRLIRAATIAYYLLHDLGPLHQASHRYRYLHDLAEKATGLYLNAAKMCVVASHLRGLNTTNLATAFYSERPATTTNSPQETNASPALAAARCALQLIIELAEHEIMSANPAFRWDDNLSMETYPGSHTPSPLLALGDPPPIGGFPDAIDAYGKEAQKDEEFEDISPDIDKPCVTILRYLNGQRLPQDQTDIEQGCGVARKTVSKKLQILAKHDFAQAEYGKNTILKRGKRYLKWLDAAES